MRKTITLVALAPVVVIGVAIGVWGVRSGTRVQPQDPNSLTGLEWRAAQAQANGETEVELAADQVMYNYVGNLDQAIENYTIVVAQPIRQRGYPDANSENVETWYKFQVTEYLRQRPAADCTGCSSLDNPPPDLLPLNANEILVPRNGGDLLVNGITIISTDAEFPAFMPSQSYLLFLDLDSTTGVGAVKVGPVGAYTVIGDRLASMFPESHPLKDDLTSRYGNSLNAFRAALNPAQPPPPSGCNPTEAQSCSDNGGTWNSSTCTCQQPFDPCVKKPWLCP